MLPESAAIALAKSRGFLSPADVRLIQRLVLDHVLDHAPATVVILGAGSGTMSLAVLEARGYQPHIARVVSVDHDQAALDWERKAWEAAGWGCEPRSTIQIFGDSAVGGTLFSGTVHMLLVDADHSAEGVHRDLEAWLPHVPHGGIVLLHDYDAKNAPNHYPGVKQAADTILVKTSWRVVARRGWSKAWQRIKY